MNKADDAWLPEPADLGLPSKFSEWRRHQPSAISFILGCDHRFSGLTAPVGSGKSLTAIAAAVIGGWRVLYLTSSKGLQSQIMHDFAHIGVVDIRGRNNYPCAVDKSLTCDQGPCVVGLHCQARGECAYWRAVRSAKESRLVVTNYSYWMAGQDAGVDLGRFDLIVADEAHSADEVVSRQLEVVLREDDLRQRWPGRLGDNVDRWRDWADEWGGVFTGEADALAQQIKDNGWSPYSVRQYTKLRRIANDVGRMADAGDDWLVEEEDARRVVRMGPVWPAPFMESALWRRVNRVLLMSATLTEKTLDLLGVGADDRARQEYPHSFPLANRLVTWVKTGVRLNFRTEIVETNKLMRVMDQIVDRREDRNGLTHTVSYARRDLYMASSRHRERMITHRSRDTEHMVWEFKRRGRTQPLIFVSPSVTTGYDFPGREAEWQIAMKIPYPDTTNKLVAARCKSDPEYASYVAMLQLVQMSGRIVRSETDVGETLIVDDNIGWFMKQYGEAMAPKWFRDAFRVAQVIPNPPKRRETGNAGEVE